MFNVSSSNGYTLSQGTGSGALTLGTSAGASITVLSGTHSISAPVMLAGSLAVSTTGGGSLQLGNVSRGDAPDRRSSLSGNGQLILSGTGSFTGGTTVSGGTLVLTNPSALESGASLTVGSTSGFGFSYLALVAAAGEFSSPAASPGAAIAAVPGTGDAALLAMALWSAAIYCRFCRRSTARAIIHNQSSIHVQISK